jgi:predicted CXXCH cytochrome family protein
MGGYGLYAWVAEDGRMLLPGRTSDAHYQIEIACSACHTPYEGVKQQACLSCHGARLAAGTDTHPVDMLAPPGPSDPRPTLDATRCISCHAEHAPHRTRGVAVTQPPDFCVHCHADISKERPSHRDFTFTTCASAGCHNYHDNTGLQEEHLTAHRREPPVLPRPVVALRERAGPTQVRKTATPPTLFQQWESSGHARAAVTCPKCHELRETPSSAPQWVKHPGPSACVACHKREVEGFLGSRHGMRLASGLPPITPAMARLPMKPAAAAREVTCGSCHTAHVFDPRPAAVEACLSCHDDEHSRAYSQSPHHTLWRLEMSGQRPPGTGVSCATCHFPRGVSPDGRKRVLTHHDPSDHLRPVTKMLRPVCQHCHGLGFSIDALADPRLARRNYADRPSRHVPTLDMIDAKVRADEQQPDQVTR